MKSNPLICERFGEPIRMPAVEAFDSRAHFSKTSPDPVTISLVGANFSKWFTSTSDAPEVALQRYQIKVPVTEATLARDLGAIESLAIHPAHLWHFLAAHSAPRKMYFSYVWDDEGVPRRVIMLWNSEEGWSLPANALNDEYQIASNSYLLSTADLSV